jgi:hypothetical protein
MPLRRRFSRTARFSCALSRLQPNKGSAIGTPSGSASVLTMTGTTALTSLPFGAAGPGAEDVAGDLAVSDLEA